MRAAPEEDEWGGRAEEKKLKQKAMADLLGLSERQYRRIECGTSAPDIWTAIRIAKALDSTVEELWSGNFTAL